MISTEDMNLIDQIRKGNQKAEEMLFIRFGSQISRKVYYAIGQSEGDWQDVVSTIQMAMLISLREGQFSPERGQSLGAYVYGITNNKLKDYYKKRKTLKSSIDHTQIDIPFNAGIHYQVERDEMQKRLRTLLKILKRKYQEVLYLKYYEELSVREISKKIGIPPRRVSERLNYAIKLLRKECENQNYFSIFHGILLILV